MINQRNLLQGLHTLDSIGWKTILKIIHGIKDLTSLLGMESYELEKLDIPSAKAQLICRSLSESYIMNTIEKYAQAGVKVITIYDEAYPTLLKQTAQPPWVLYTLGDINLLQKLHLGIVGTRTPTVYGKKVAEQLAASLSDSGFCVVSGMARGIDSSAHWGALQGNGGTIAVLGCGIDIIYPSENKLLYREMKAKGLILSEYPLGTSAQPGLFPMRNRIIAGLSLGTIVVEAALRSGSLITADQALEESRDVFAVPGPITSPKSLGTLSLIKQGAKLVTCYQDIVEEYEHLLTKEQLTTTKIAASNQRERKVEMTAEEKRIYDCLSTEPTTIDQLLEQSQTNFGHLHLILLSLLMKKEIEQLPGSAYIII